MPALSCQGVLAHNGGQPEPRWFAYPPLSRDFEEGGFDRIQHFYSLLLPPPEDYEPRDFRSTAEHFRSELA